MPIKLDGTITSPTIDFEPVIYAKWIEVEGMSPPEQRRRHKCSNCGHLAGKDWKGHKEDLTPICPLCGAKMKRREDANA